MQVCLELAGGLAGEIPRPAGSQWKLQSVLDMKLREFTPPGKNLELEVRVKERTDTSAIMLMVRIKAGENVVGSARLLLALEKV